MKSNSLAVHSISFVATQSRLIARFNAEY